MLVECRFMSLAKSGFVSSLRPRGTSVLSLGFADGRLGAGAGTVAETREAGVAVGRETGRAGAKVIGGGFDRCMASISNLCFSCSILMAFSSASRCSFCWRRILSTKQCSQ